MKKPLLKTFLTLFLVFKMASLSADPLLNMSDLEFTSLEDMWEVLYVKGNFGYTLIGRKPVSILNWPVTKNAHAFVNDPLIPLYVGMARDTWEKLSAGLSKRNFSLSFNNFSVGKDIYQEIVLINKTTLKECLEKYGSFFNAYIQDDIEKTILSILRSGNHLLIGLVLGFGLENSREFHKTYEVMNCYRDGTFFPYEISLSSEDIEWLKIGSEKGAFQTSYCALNPKDFSNKVLECQKNKPLSSTSNMQKYTLFPIPSFSIFSQNKETKDLITNYLYDQKIVTEFYEDRKNFLPKIISLFNSDIP